jgi:branched-chain amino acid transport system ATP-binding protein
VSQGVSEGLELQELSVFYGHARALHRASLTIPASSITALVGPNGAGKSSLILATYGAVRSRGRVLFKGSDLSRLSAMARAKAGLTLVPQGRQIFPTLTVRENLVIMCRLLGLSRDHVEAAYQRFPILKVRSRQIAGVLSGGEQQMLAVSRALMGSPSVVLLDEMTTGLAPIIVERLMETARELAASGVAVLMAEPSIGVIRDRIDRGYVLLRGEVVAEAGGGVELEAAYQKAMGMTLVES